VPDGSDGRPASIYLPAEQEANADITVPGPMEGL